MKTDFENHCRFTYFLKKSLLVPDTSLDADYVSREFPAVTVFSARALISVYIVSL